MFIRKFDTRNFRFAVAITVLFALASCTDDAPGMEEETSSETGTETETETGTETETETETGDEMMLAIVGSYTDDFGDMHTISETEWTNSAGGFAIAQYDNDEMWLVAQNAETNMFSPGLWSRFDWAWDGEQLYYCQSVFDGATMEAALAGSANADDLMMGCGGFPWSQLTPQ